MNLTERDTSKSGNGSSGGATEGIVNSMDQMMRLPLQMTGATWDLMMQGMRNMTGTASRRSSNSTVAATDAASTTSAVSQNLHPQDLGGDDLKYVVWSLIFTKPGLECVLEPQHSEIVNYEADVSSFAAVKIARFLEHARHGRVEKAECWREHDYPPEFARSETNPSDASSASTERGWRIPADDQKYIVFLHRVEWRLPKQEDVTRVERVTIERGTSTTRIA